MELKIGFIHPGNAFLPEIEAYTEFFSSRGFKTCTMNTEIAEKNPTEIEWHFMGTHYKRQNRSSTLIHEYSSASTPPFANIKDFVKRTINCKPDYRIFLNPYVRKKFSFNDGVPNGTRDMAVAEYFHKQGISVKKEFDFIYVGDVSDARKMSGLFNCFTNGRLSGRSLLILSRDFHHHQKDYAMFPNIMFAGPVNHSQVPGYIEKARFAINFIPPIEPFIHQTSTKLLEYAAMEIPIVTNSYNWIQDFQGRYGGSYFFLQKDFDNFTWEKVCGFKYSFPDLSEWNWDTQIKRSGIIEFLQSLSAKV